MDVRDFWAKSDPHHALWRHLLDVAAVCAALLRRFGPIESIPDKWVTYIAAMHDIGKADPEFQNKDVDLANALRASGVELPAERTAFRHEARSAEWIVPQLQVLGWSRYACRVVSMATRAHHGDFRAGLHGAGTYYEENQPHLRQRTESWSQARQDLDELVKDALQLKGFAAPDFDDASAAGIRLAGLIVLSDWIASNADLYGYEQLDHKLTPRDYFAASSQRAEQVIRSMQLDRTGLPPDGYTAPAFSEVWPRIGEPRPFQTALETTCRTGLLPGLAILEAPMGEGKTEAAIYLALHWNRLLGREGVYIGLPTMATSNQMYSRYRSFLEEVGGAEPRLIHGMSWLFADDTPEGEFETFGDPEEATRAKDWFRNSKRAILAPEGVGTIDQVLMAALNVKHGFLRLLGLSARTLIIDEVHAYDVYMNALLRRLLAWCRILHIPVILLSATLSQHQKQDLVHAYGGELPLHGDDPAKEPYPLLTFVPWEAPAFCRKAEASSARTLQIERYYGALPGRDRRSKEIAWERTARLAERVTEHGGCICVLMNTVAGAQAVYRALGKRPNKLLFHARFTALRRNEIETEVLRLFGKGADGRPENPHRPKEFILVCSQVVEQSLDVDFDAMITELAPIDLLLQRSGRVWRHERGVRVTGDHPTLHILLPAESAFAAENANTAALGATGRVYSHHEVLYHTLAQVNNRIAFDLPRDFRPLIESCYGGDIQPDGVAETIYRRAVAASRKQDDEDENAARTHLIAEPSEHEFSLGRMLQVGVEEGEDGDAPSYFRARTRLGDETRNAFFVEDVRLERAISRGLVAKERGDRKHAYPGNDTLRVLFLQKATIPAWWLRNLEPAEDYDWIRERDGPDWTRRHIVFFLKDGMWRCTRDGVDTFLRNDPEIGIVMEALDGRTYEPTAIEEAEDADVGFAG